MSQRDQSMSTEAESRPLLHVPDPEKTELQKKFVSRNNHVQLIADRLSIALGIEAFGSFTLAAIRVLIGNNPHLVPTVGIVYLVFAMFSGHQSGNHLNPAISMAFYLRGKFNKQMFILYSLVQYVFAILGAVITYYIILHPSFATETYGHKHMTMLHQPNQQLWQLFVIEFFYMFWFVLFYLIKVTTFMSRYASFYQIYMGAYLAVSLGITGTLTPGLLSPANTIACTIPAYIVYGSENIKYIWIYLVSQYSASAIASWVFLFMSPNDIKREIREEGHGNLHWKAY